MPLVSIITPSFNQARYLEQTIQSVLRQDHPRIEHIVVDGASTDGSVEIIKKYADKLAWWVSEKDSGQADAINKGLARAAGEIVAWLNSDDYYLPGAVSAAVKLFEENPDVVLVYGNMLAVDERGNPFNTLTYKQLTMQDLLCFQIIGQPAVFFRRSALEKTDMLDSTFHFLLDHHLWIRIAQHGRILHVDQTWAAARYHAEAKNRAKAAEFGREAFRILAWAESQPKLGAAIRPVERRARASAHRVDARYLLDGGKSASALRAWMRAFFIHPPTALARLNIFVSALLNILGLDFVRSVFLSRRSRSMKDKKDSMSF
ncbi:MAG TPA: glycosyltransferase family 2 protein [Anaerolineales bacterium]|nr:glycosyltransferase family 2 protein [Anaerolineales bacterium]